MLLKLVSFIASIILIFTPSVALPEKPDALVETLDNLSVNRTADEINGTNIAGRSAETAVFTNIEITSNTFTDIPSRLMKANNVNGFVFSENNVDTGECFDKNNCFNIAQT